MLVDRNKLRFDALARIGPTQRGRQTLLAGNARDLASVRVAAAACVERRETPAVRAGLRRAEKIMHLALQLALIQRFQQQHVIHASSVPAISSTVLR